MPGMTVSPEEVARFDALAARWWDPDGPMRPLHRMNPARVAWIVERMRSDTPPPLAGGGWGRGPEPNSPRPLPPTPSRKGRGSIGLGILPHSRPLRPARRRLRRRAGSRGAGAPRLRRAGPGRRRRGDRGGTRPRRGAGPAARLPDRRRRGPAGGGPALPGHHRARGDRARARPGGLPGDACATCWRRAGKLFLSTLNRTPRSFLAAKVAAEYLLRWLPVGTHDWRRFITPAELAAMLRDLGFRVTDVTGLVADPLTGQWRDRARHRT